MMFCEKDEWRTTGKDSMYRYHHAGHTNRLLILPEEEEYNHKPNQPEKQPIKPKEIVRPSQ